MAKRKRSTGSASTPPAAAPSPHTSASENAPGINKREQISALVVAVAPKPINLLVGGASPMTLKDIEALGVRRISVDRRGMSRATTVVCLIGALLYCFAPRTGEAEETAASPAASAPVEEVPDVANAVVKVFSTMRYPDVLRPWSKQQPTEVSGSGVVIENKRILTNAHVVLYASQVQIQANQAGDKIPATVEFVAPGIDDEEEEEDEAEDEEHDGPRLVFPEELEAFGDFVEIQRMHGLSENHHQLGAKRRDRDGRV